MSKISIIIDKNNSISNILNFAVNNGDYVVVEDNPSFKVSERFQWTIRQSDNVLVHKSTGLTPEEESQKSSTEITNVLMANAKDIDDIKQSITALTSMQLGGN